MSKRMQLVISVVLASWMVGTAAPQGGTPSVSKAGSVSAVLPNATIEGSHRSAKSVPARQGDDLVWEDLLRTDKQGRLRVTLVDESVLSLGSNSELRLTKHDATSQQSSFELKYGLIRMQIIKLLRGQGLQLRTPTATAGVVGTDFGADASDPQLTKFVCLAGEVHISNVDPSVPGTVVCPGGSTTTVRKGEPPTTPVAATEKQMQRWRGVTDPAFPAVH